jgi:hypothetical protein
MNPSLTSSLAMALAAMLSACGSPATVALDQTASSTLASLQQAPESAGQRVYAGDVFPIASAGGKPVFRYERRIQDRADGMLATHLTRDAGGQVVVSESARFTPDYRVTRFEAIHAQAGYSGSVEVRAGQLQYRLQHAGRLLTATEQVDDPVVTGPSLHGFILRHWDALLAGQTIPVRMIVLSKLESYGFEIRHAGSAQGSTAFSITPSSLLVRLAVAPLRVEFDSTSRHVLRYQGRVPPMQLVDGKPRALDARVEYRVHAALYR